MIKAITEVQEEHSKEDNSLGEVKGSIIGLQCLGSFVSHFK